MTLQLCKYVILLRFYELQGSGAFAWSKGWRCPRSGRAYFDLMNKLVATLLLQFADLIPHQYRSFRVRRITETTGAAKNGAQALPFLKSIASRELDLAIDRDGFANIVPAGDLMNRQNISRLQGAICASFCSPQQLRQCGPS